MLNFSSTLFVLTAVFFSTFLSMLTAQDASIRGKVTDRVKGDNIVGAKIMVLKDGRVKKTVFSDAAGNFVIEELDYGTFDLECQTVSYRPQRFVGIQLKKASTRLAYFKIDYAPEVYTACQKSSKKAEENTELIYTYASLQAKQNIKTTLATSTNESQLDIPNTGYLISREDIQMRGYQYLIDVLEDIPEFEWQEKVNPEFVNIISARSLSGSGRWIIMQDGIRINSMGGSDNVVLSQNISVRAAKNIEIIIGPASALYGADAFAGVINIITYKGEELNSATIQLNRAQYNTFEQNAQFGFKYKQLSVAGQGHYYRSENPYMPKYYPEQYGWFDSLYRPNNQMMGSTFLPDTMTLSQPTDAFDISTLGYSFGVRANYKNWEFGLMRNSESHSSSLGYYYRYALPTQRSYYATNLTNFYLKHNLERERYNLTSSFQVSYWNIDPQSRFASVYSRYQSAYKYGLERNLMWREALNYKIGENQNLSIGFALQAGQTLAQSNFTHPWVEGQTAEEQGQYYIGTDIVTYEGDSLKILQQLFTESRLAAGLFAQYQIEIRKKLSIIVGGRFDFIRSIHTYEANEIFDYPIIAPRLGFVYKPTASFRLKASFSTGILSPSFQKTHNNFGSFSPAVDSLGRVVGLQASYWRLPTEDDNSQPESSRSFELSSSYTKNDFFVSGNAYYTLLDNLYQLETVRNSPFVANDGQTIINVPVAEVLEGDAKGNVYGGMIRFDYRFFFGKKHDFELQTGLSYAYVDGLIIDKTGGQPDKKPFNNAPHTFKGQFLFRYKTFSTSLRFIYRSATLSEGSGVGTNFSQVGNPAFLLVNLYSRWQVYTAEKLDISLSLRVRNLFDNRYYNTSAPSAAAIIGVPQDPIRIGGGIVFVIK